MGITFDESGDAAALDDTMNGTAEADESTTEEPKKKFKWDKMIKSCLKSADENSLSVKNCANFYCHNTPRKLARSAGRRSSRRNWSRGSTRARSLLMRMGPSRYDVRFIVEVDVQSLLRAFLLDY